MWHVCHFAVAPLLHALLSPLARVSVCVIRMHTQQQSKNVSNWQLHVAAFCSRLLPSPLRFGVSLGCTHSWGMSAESLSYFWHSDSADIPRLCTFYHYCSLSSRSVIMSLSKSFDIDDEVERIVEDLMFEDEVEMMMMMQAKELDIDSAEGDLAEEGNKRKWGGSVPGKKPNKRRDHQAAHEKLHRQYLGEDPVYDDADFKRRLLSYLPMQAPTIARRLSRLGDCYTPCRR
jgi:hypothetical protein